MPASPRTSGSRRPAWSSSSATASRQEFDRDKLAAGIRKALTRRPVPDGAAERAADEIEATLRAAGADEVESSRIGELAMEQLRALDQIAYIRFASVYQSFEDLETLKREVDSLYAEREPESGGAPVVSVLADRDIRAELEAGRIRIEPYDPADLQPSSVDLHLDRSFRVFRNNRYAFIDPREPQPDLTELLGVRDDEPFILHPGEFVLGQTIEWVELPTDLVARLEGKSSSLGRLGLLIHSTAGYVDPGWKGTLTLELSNVANLPIALYAGMRIGQISFFRMSSPVERPYGTLGARLEVPGPEPADGLGLPPRLRRPAEAARASG